MVGAKSHRNIYLILSLIFIFTLGIVIYIVQYQTNAMVGELTLNRVQTANRSLVNYVTELQDRVIIRAELVSSSETIISAVKNSDYNTLQRLLTSFMLGMDFASICDAKGIVLARSHSKMTEDNILKYKGVVEALRTGMTATSIEMVHSRNGSLSIYASAPIYDNGSIIGFANCAYDLTRNEYVDVFKERTGSEATIFLSDERISTTIKDASGKRIIGTKAYDFIAEAVIRQQKEYLGHLDIYGVMYGVCYSPLLSNGVTIGMLFTGVDLRSTLASQRAMNFWIIAASCLGIVVSVAFMLFSNIIAQKYARFAEKQLNQQILMANISRNFVTDTLVDTLVTDTLRMVGEFMRIPQVLLFWLNDGGLTLTCRNGWTNRQTPLSPRVGDSMPVREPLFSALKGLNPGSGQNACLSSDDLDCKEAMAPYRVHYTKYITAPIFIKDNMIGVLDFAEEEDGRKWDDSDISLASLVASTLSGVFEREAMGRRTSIVENSPHTILYADFDGNLAYANPAAAAVTGYTVAEIKAGGFALLFDEQTVRDIKEVFIPKTRLHGKDHHELILLCKDGQKRLLDVTSFIVKDEIVAVIAMDLTEIRALESELNKAKEKVEHASRAKSEFLSRMSHEMRTPMNAIIGLTEIARNSTEIDKIQSCLEKTSTSSRHLLSIIDDILDMTSIEAGSLKLVYEECSLEKMLLDTVDAISAHTHENKQNLSVHLDSNLPQWIICDAQRLNQAIMNLLSNAVKFTPEGGNISLDVHVTDISGDMYTIQAVVADNGIGIAREAQSRLFEPFEQVDGGLARKYGGTGLGLSINKQIIEQMGGKIWVESEPGRGSKFSFAVPVKKGEGHIPGACRDATALVQPNEARSMEAGDAPQVFENRTLLIAEDVELNRMIVEEMLSTTGFAIEFAENGQQALDMYIANPGRYSLILMDINMPEMDGYTATQGIRTLDIPGSAEIPIIAMTANVFQQDIDKCLGAGMNDHIGKPLDVGILISKVNKYIK